MRSRWRCSRTGSRGRHGTGERRARALRAASSAGLRAGGIVGRGLGRCAGRGHRRLGRSFDADCVATLHPSVPYRGRRDRRRARGPGEDLRQRARRPARARRRRHRRRARASSSPSSGARARASRRCCTSSARSTAPEAGTIEVAGRAHRRPPRARADARAPAPGRLRLPVLPPRPRADAARRTSCSPRGCRAAPAGALARGRELIARPRAHRRGRAAAARALRRRAAAPGGGPRARARPAARARRRADRQPRRRGGRRRARAPARARPTTAARSSSSPTTRRRRARPTASCACATGAWSREARAGSAFAGRAARRGDGGRRGDRRATGWPPASTAPRAQADLPDVMVRFRPERAPRSTRSCGALPNLAGALVPPGGRPASALAAAGLVGQRARRARRPGPARLRDRRRARRRRARRTRSSIERGVANAWTCGVGDDDPASGGWARCAWRASRWRPTTSPSRWPRCRTSTSRSAWLEARGPAALRRQPGADLGRRPRPRRRAAPAGARHEHPVRGRALRHPRGRARADRLGRRGRHRAARRLLARRPRAPPAIMLAATTAADVQRRLPAIGVQRAIGVSRGAVAARARPRARPRSGSWPARSGVAAGALAVARRRAGGLLEALNEQPPGWALRRRRWRGALLAIVALVARRGGVAGVAGDGRPTGRAAARRRARRAPRRLRLGGGFAALGARLALARRGRAAATLAVLAVSGAVVLLMLGLASLVAALRDDPGSVGKRYELTARLPADRARRGPRAPRRRRRRAALRRARRRLLRPRRAGEAPRLPRRPHALRGPAARRRAPAARDDEAEVGVGLAQALGIGVGLDARRPAAERRRGALPRRRDRARARRRRPRRLRAPARGCWPPTRAPAPQVVVRLARRRRRAAVTPRLRDLGASRAAVGGATTRNGAFLGHARHAAARRRGRRRARVPLRARPGARAHRPRARADARAAARHRAPRAGPSARCWPAPRSPSRCRPRCSALALERLVLAPLVGAPGRGLRRPRRRGLGRARRRSSSAGWRCWASWPPRGSRGGPSPSRPSRGCGRSDARRPLALALVAVASRSPAAAAAARGPPAGGRLDARARPGATPTATASSPAGPASRCATAPTSRRRPRPGARWRTLAILTDVHVRDEESPGPRAVPRPPRRPVLLDLPPAGGALRRRSSTPPCARSTPRGPTPSLVTGDLVDNAQANELALARTRPRRRAARPDSGAPRLRRASRAPTTPTPPTTAPTSTRRATRACSAAAQRPFRAPGLRAPWYAVPGNHDLLVAGELARTPRPPRSPWAASACVTPDAGLDVPRSEDALTPQLVDAR